MSTINRRIAIIAKRKRKMLGLTQSQVPGLTLRQVQRIEQGEHSPSADTTDNVARALGTSLRVLTDLAEEVRVEHMPTGEVFVELTRRELELAQWFEPEDIAHLTDDLRLRRWDTQDPDSDWKIEVAIYDRHGVPTQWQGLEMEVERDLLEELGVDLEDVEVEPKGSSYEEVGREFGFEWLQSLPQDADNEHALWPEALEDAEQIAQITVLTSDADELRIGDAIVYEASGPGAVVYRLKEEDAG